MNLKKGEVIQLMKIYRTLTVSDIRVLEFFLGRKGYGGMYVEINEEMGLPETQVACTRDSIKKWVACGVLNKYKPPRRRHGYYYSISKTWMTDMLNLPCPDEPGGVGVSASKNKPDPREQYDFFK